MKKLLILGFLTLTGCGSLSHQPPGACELDATNYQCVIDAKNYLNPDFHSRILVVRFTDERNPGLTKGHAYCMWRAKGLYYAYDILGTQHLFTRADGGGSALWFAEQLKKNVVGAWYESPHGADQNFENE